MFKLETHGLSLLFAASTQLRKSFQVSFWIKIRQFRIKILTINKKNKSKITNKSFKKIALHYNNKLPSLILDLTYKFNHGCLNKPTKKLKLQTRSKMDKTLSNWLMPASNILNIWPVTKKKLLQVLLGL